MPTKLIEEENTIYEIDIDCKHQNDLIGIRNQDTSSYNMQGQSIKPHECLNNYSYIVLLFVIILSIK